MAEEPVVEKFNPTGGRVMGYLGVAACLVLLVVGVIDGFALWLMGLILLAGIGFWTTMLRPAVSIVDDDLALRNMVSDLTIPLGAIEEIQVRQVMALRAGDKRYVSSAASRTRRQIVKGSKQPRADKVDLIELAQHSYPEYVRERIAMAAGEHRDRLGIRRNSPEQQALAAGITRRWAWPEIALLGLAAALVVIGIIVA